MHVLSHLSTLYNIQTYFNTACASLYRTKLQLSYTVKFGPSGIQTHNPLIVWTNTLAILPRSAARGYSCLPKFLKNLDGQVDNLYPHRLSEWLMYRWMIYMFFKSKTKLHCVWSMWDWNSQPSDLLGKHLSHLSSDIDFKWTNSVCNFWNKSWGFKIPKSTIIPFFIFHISNMVLFCVCIHLSGLLRQIIVTKLVMKIKIKTFYQSYNV